MPTSTMSIAVELELFVCGFPFDAVGQHSGDDLDELYHALFGGAYSSKTSSFVSGLEKRSTVLELLDSSARFV